MNQLLVTFIALNILNVIIQTVKSLVTIKCKKTMASLVNALAYGLYTIVVVYMMCDLPLLLKAGIIAFCNLVGVYVVKLVEEKISKEKLWKIEATVLKEQKEKLSSILNNVSIPFNYVEAGPWCIFNIYSATSEDSLTIKKILSLVQAKYFVSETKIL